ncbi:poly(A) polymerase [Embleya sp. NPDC050154]|uniref:poly(A) polymerase n=1 Tax=Embleya sp. NPDC050154 TaxID=3363988 RepID=UPI0037AAA9AB
MRTSEEIYHRVRWDPRFDPARFVLEVSRRGADPKRIPLPAFVPGGEIPWHRVLRIEADGEVVWDRAARVDRIEHCVAGRARDPRRLRAPFFTAREPHTFDPSTGRWRPATASGADPIGLPDTARIRVLTWNTLWDRYDADRIDTARRRPMLLAALAAADADVIALQEVEPELALLLAAQPWVRAAYTMDTDPAGRDVPATGLLLLSRLPVREAGRHALGPYKAVAAITVAGPAEPLVLAVTHLTSDHTQDGAGRRRIELAALAAGFAGIPGDLVVVGDFNDGTTGPAAALGLTDVWTDVHGADDHTPTFDPGVNPLAAIGSLTGRAARLDRILSRTGSWRAGTAVLRGDTPGPDGLYASDHFGVQADLLPAANPPAGDVLDVAPSARTALAWLPPGRLWPALQRARRAHDPQVDRWPPHVNVLFGFVPEADFDRAAPLLAAAAARVTPFTAELDGVHTFGHREDATVWLDPAAADELPWARMREAFAAHFPRCLGRTSGYTPHLTLGRSTDAQRVAAACARELEPMTARVGELVLLSRRGDEPMRPRAVLTLGTGALRELPDPDPVAGTDATGSREGSVAGGRARKPSDRVREPVGAEREGTARAPLATDPGNDTREHRAADPEGDAHLRPRSDRPGDTRAPRADDPDGDARTRRIARRVSAALGEGVVSVVGSRRMGCASPDADLDLVAALPGTVDPADIAARIAAALPEAGGIRPVLGARVPGLRLRVDDSPVDLALIGTGRIAPADAVARRAELGEPAAVTLSAITDADAIRGAVGADHERFADLARRIKAWARARGLDAAPFGGLPGLAWSVLAARTTREAAHVADEDLPAYFFAGWAAWDWRVPVALDDDTARAGTVTGGPVSILTPTHPVRSCTEQVGHGGRDLLVDELYRAWELLTPGEASERDDRDPWAALIEPPPLHRRHAAWAVLTVLPASAEECAATTGRLRGRIRGLLTTLQEAGVQDAHAWPRPFVSDSRTRYAIGLGADPPSATDLAELTERWRRGLPGVETTWADGGSVPTLR